MTALQTQQVGVTKEQISSAVQVIVAVGQVIREFGEAPAGPIFAALQAKFNLSFKNFNTIISKLKETGCVVERGDVLVWVEPK